ncbi:MULTISPECIES: hypothetical protein [unclassified Klebsiella]|nr:MULTISPECIES: hypothetical protein [unclassified Klebsiella]BBQ83227.1 hypothetical protein WP3W18E02_17560 [Klebsiella sp. WP3-W18-ESBL-02]BBR20321.1 hypothetical protein WP3S18E05_18010 [Klebsiella sp. WP3-S18-ESBL-05]
MEIISSVLFLIVIFILYRSSFVFSNISIDNGFVETPVRVTVMLALSVCAMHVLVQFLNGSVASYIVGCVLLFLAINSYFANNNKKPVLIFAVVLSLFVILPRVYGLYIIKDLVPLEGTGNHDDLWYIFRALRLQDYSVNARVSSSIFDYLAATTAVTFDSLPRIGSELVLVFFSTLTRFEVYQSYPLVFALAALLLVSAACAFVNTKEKHYYLLLLVGAVVSISPSMLYVWANGNYATLWGMVFFGLGYYFYTKSINSGRYGVDCFITGLLFATLLSTYPELLSVAIPSIIIFLGIHLFIHKNFIYIIKFNLLIALLVVCLAPFGTYDAINTFITTSSAVNEGNNQYPGLFDLLNVYNGIFFISTLYISSDDHWYQKILLVLFSLSILYGIFRVDSNQKKTILPVLLSSLLIYGAMYLKNYPYGAVKAVEFISLPLMVLLSCFVYCSLGKHKRKNEDKCRWVDLSAVIILVFGMGYGFSKTLTESIRISSVKHLSRDIVSLGSSLNNTRDDILLVEDNLGDFGFMKSRWISYFLNGRPVIFAPSLQAGGYIYNLKDVYEKYKSEAKLKLVLTESLGTHDDVIFKNNTYAIKRISPDYYENFQLNGFSNQEGWGAWIGKNASIKFDTSCSRTASFDVVRRFEGMGTNHIIHIRVGSHEKTYNYHDGETLNITVPISSEFPEVYITADGEVKSPKDLNMSSDDRYLSYGIKSIHASKCQ